MVAPFHPRRAEKSARPSQPGARFRVTDPFADPPATDPPPPRLRPDELAALGRRVGLAFKADPANREAVGNLALAAHVGLRKFDPSGRLGAAFRVYCGLKGMPAQPWFPAAFPHHRLPAEVPSFWDEQITGVGASVDAVMIADDPAFSEAFVDEVIR